MISEKVHVDIKKKTNYVSGAGDVAVIANTFSAYLQSLQDAGYIAEGSVVIADKVTDADTGKKCSSISLAARIIVPSGERS